MNKKKTPIQGLNDSEFISFLFAERDRENNLCQYQGWNNWVLSGAIFTLICFIYYTIKDAGQIDLMRCVYYATGLVSIFLAYNSWLLFFKRKRGNDYTRVRFLKEKTPWMDAALAIITSITAFVFILVYDCSSYVLWAWIAAFTAQVVAFSFALINRNRVVPVYYVRSYFTRPWCNFVYEGIAGLVYYLVGRLSFKRASLCIWDQEFEIGICVGSIAVMVYFLIKINIDNKPVLRFDEILDRYLYTGVSKEETYHNILCNRMGYGVLEACVKELSKVKEMSEVCNKKNKELTLIKYEIQNGQYDYNQILECFKMCKEIPVYLNKSLRQSKQLSLRLKEIVSIAPVLDQAEEVNFIFEINKELYATVNATRGVLDEVQKMLRNEINKFYSRKSNTQCPNLNCECRNAPTDK